MLFDIQTMYLCKHITRHDLYTGRILLRSLSSRISSSSPLLLPYPHPLSLPIPLYIDTDETFIPTLYWVRGTMPTPCALAATSGYCTYDKLCPQIQKPSTTIHRQT